MNTTSTSGLPSGRVAAGFTGVWEHAYRLMDQSRRSGYTSALYNVVHWADVARRYATVRG